MYRGEGKGGPDSPNGEEFETSSHSSFYLMKREEDPKTNTPSSSYFINTFFNKDSHYFNMMMNPVRTY
jgi:hypothetical protein